MACRPFGVTPDRARVDVGFDSFDARYGLWRVRTRLANVADVSVTGPFQWWFVAGPAHLSRTDHGITFATTDDRGACLRFHEPVAPVYPFPRWAHPGLTVTPVDVDGFVALVRERAGLAPAG
jgi:hypothetical protein